MVSISSCVGGVISSRFRGSGGYSGSVCVCFWVCFLALKWGGFVDVRWSMCAGGSKGLVCVGWAYWGPKIILSMLSSGWYVVEDPGVSWRTTIGPCRIDASAFRYTPG